MIFFPLSFFIFHLIFRFLVTCLARVHPSMSPVQLRYSKHIIAQAIKLALTKENVTSSFQKGPPEALGGIQFFPKSFFELKYYPYYGKLRHVRAHL